MLASPPKQGFSFPSTSPPSMTRPSLLLLSLLAALPLRASEPLVVKLWPSGAPEKPGVAIEAEKRIEPKSGKDVLRVTNVTEPTLTVYRPAPPITPNGTAVLVCPGGGYGILAIEHEGTQVCDWLNSLGVTAVLLKYRVPVRDKTPGYEPLQDAQRAIGIVRQNALHWGINPKRVGILGFSAGGHLSVMASLHANERTYPTDPALDVADATPNFLIPIYPAYLVGRDDTFTLLPSIQVTPASPPICLVHAHDDNGVTSASASALLYVEYKKLNRPAELHIFSSGGHGFGMRQSEKPVAQWPQRVGEWMRTMGLLNPATEQ
jgi:acetyl esterase/lipase